MNGMADGFWFEIGRMGARAFMTLAVIAVAMGVAYAVRKR